MSVDIEDIRIDSAEEENHITPTVHINRRGEKVNVEEIYVAESTIIPEEYKLWIATFGCAHNFADGEYMKGILADFGYPFVENKEEADLWILNSCTVKDPSETAFHNLVDEATRKGIKLVVAGCVPQADSDAPWLRSLSILGVKQVHRILEVVEETLKGNKIQLLSQRGLPPLDLPKVRKDPYIEIVPISEGCLGHCTYCKTRFARGTLVSYPLSQIQERLQQAIRDGVFEIWLSSEDTGAYGIDLHRSVADLLHAAMDVFASPSPTMLRLGMTNPPYILHHLPAIVEFLRHPNVFAFIHIPVQSGSDRVLGLMQRAYTAQEFCRVCDYLLEHCPGVTIATDVIVGFAGETEEDHRATMRLLQHYELPVVNISKFFPRPGTPAAAMPRLSTVVVKQRSSELSAWFKGLAPYAQYEGRAMLVWVGSETAGEWLVGHTKAYIKVLVKGEEALRGKRVVVRVCEAHRFHLVGEIIDAAPSFAVPACSPSELDALVKDLYG